MKNGHLLSLTGISILLFTGFLCRFEKDNDCSADYAFTIDMTMTPGRDTFQVGDTIWLVSTIPAWLEDTISGLAMNVSEFDFRVKAAVTRLDSIPYLPGEGHFSYIYELGRFDIHILSQTINTDVYYADGANGEKKLRIGMICRKKGLFQWAFYNLRDDIHGVNFFKPDCYEKLHVIYRMNGDADNHYYLVETSKNPIPTEEVFRLEAGFAFLVV